MVRTTSMSDDVTPRRELNRYFRDSLCNEWIDLIVEALEEDRAVVTVPHDEKLTNPGGTVHRGILAAVMDVTASAVLLYVVEDFGGMSLLNTDMNIRYLRPATGDLRASGFVERAGSSMGVARMNIESSTADESSEKVASGSVFYRFL